MSVKRWFEILSEVLDNCTKLGTISKITFTGEQITAITNKIYEEENKDRRTLEISGKKPITEKQKRYLKDLGYTNYGNLDKQKASELIDELKVRRKK